MADFEQEKLQALIDQEEISQKGDIDDLKNLNNLLTVFDECDPVTRADASVYFAGLGCVEAEIRGHGFAELIAIIVRAATLR